ncbi:MAG: hypothetical protein KatS3mg102_1131 [Planctomycetota bacterium]|nr:MAG: hypothetical protein KatS3mg102_1131 [Planctomycetota bacterium]
MMERCPYQVLGLERGADAEQVRRAYRRLARRFHPDLNREADAAARFREVREAYEAIGRQWLAARGGSGARASSAAGAAEPLRAGPWPAGGRAEVPGTHAAWAEALEALAAWLGQRAGRAELGAVLAGWWRRGAAAFAEVLRRRPCLAGGRVTGSHQVALTAYLTHEQARRGVVLPFRFSLGPHALEHRLRIPAGVRHGDLLEYRVPAPQGELFVAVEVDLA